MSKKNKYPARWSEVYPQGTQEGDEEQRFFKSLTRNPEWTWLSTAHISKEARLPLQRVEEIASKYLQKGMVFQHPSNVDQWGYWELNKDHLPKKQLSISGRDQRSRVDKIMGKTTHSCTGHKAKQVATARAIQKKAAKSGKGKWVQKTLFTTH